MASDSPGPVQGKRPRKAHKATRSPTDGNGIADAYAKKAGTDKALDRGSKRAMERISISFLKRRAA